MQELRFSIILSHAIYCKRPLFFFILLFMFVVIKCCRKHRFRATSYPGWT